MAKKKKKRPGPPPGRTKVKMDSDTLARVRELGAAGISQLLAAKCLGISEDTFGRYLDDHAEFAEAWRAGRASVFDLVAAAAKELVPKLLAEALAGDGRSRDTLLRLLDESFHPPQVDATGGAQAGAPTVQFILPDNGRPRYVDAKTVEASPLLPSPGPAAEKKGG